MMRYLSVQLATRVYGHLKKNSCKYETSEKSLKESRSRQVIVEYDIVDEQVDAIISLPMEPSKETRGCNISDKTLSVHYYSDNYGATKHTP